MKQSNTTFFFHIFKHVNKGKFKVFLDELKEANIHLIRRLNNIAISVRGKRGFQLIYILRHDFFLIKINI